MNFVKSIVLTALMFSGVSAFAHHDDKNGPCKTYWESCKDTKGKKAKWACVKDAAAADTVNGPACTASMEKHHPKHGNLDKQADKNQMAPDATPVPAAH
jgi:hypothetical protein